MYYGVTLLLVVVGDGWRGGYAVAVAMGSRGKDMYV
jgi:hypothetical protein